MIYAIVSTVGTVKTTIEASSASAALDAYVAPMGYDSYDEYSVPCSGEPAHIAVAAWVEPAPVSNSLDTLWA